MKIVRRVVGVGRWLAGLGRLAIVLGLLAALWIGTVNGVDRASRDADQRRASDRVQVAAGFAGSIREWLTAGRSEVRALSTSVAEGRSENVQPAVDAFRRSSHEFTRDALVIAGGTVVAATPGVASLVGLRPAPCVNVDESGERVTDDELDALTGRARGGTDAAVSRIFDVPGDCRPSVGIAIASGSLTTVVLGETSDLTTRLSAASMIDDSQTVSSSEGSDPVPVGGTRVLLVTRDVALDPTLGIVSVPPRVAAFTERAANGGRTLDRYSIGNAGDAAVLAAAAPVEPQWWIVLEQDAAVFDIELQNRPSVVVASLLTIVFGVVFALIALFDVRRRRAHRRAEIAKNAFFSIAGHELRTPLTVIKGFTEMLSGRWVDLDDERRRGLVERILPQTRRLDRLVERLLVAASIQAETFTRPRVTVVDPVPLLEAAAERFRAEAPLHAFVVHAADDVADVYGDPQALDQVLEHLVDNAVKYSPSGGRVWLGAERRHRRVRLIVEDEGIGLPSDRRHIFEKFVQGESVTKRVHDEGGVGLGLYIVRTLVEEMGGTVHAEPRDVGGARFVVALRAANVRDGSFRSRSTRASETAGQQTVS